MESYGGLFLLLIATLATIHIVQAQDQQGFISLDCGLPANEQSPYNETFTKLHFSSDATFIQSGKTDRVQANLLSRYLKPYTTLRYFPDGIRNCYDLNVDKGRTYLIRASFVYGNYDGRDIKPVFDLYLGPNLWAKIDLETRVNGTREDILHVPTSNSLQICLVKTDETTPLISALELRPMGNDSYITKSGSLNQYYWYDVSKSRSQPRYPSDIYDRIWTSYFKVEWTEISTDLEVSNSNDYAPAKDALKTAATPTDTNAPLTFEWSLTNPDDQYYFYAHFSEIQDLQANETREFDILLNGAHLYGPFVPRRRGINTIFTRGPRTCDGGKCSFQLTRTNRSTLPPLLNAFEIYTVIQFPQSETDESDVVAIKNIAATYGLSRINWQGDPCVPQQLRWDGLNCSNTEMSMPPRITSLNLSSSGLTGTIVAAIQNLTQLEKLDLSNNNLTGGVPEFLGNMKSLSVINLSGNNLNGSIPQALQNKGLELSVEGNLMLCLSDSCIKPPKKKVLVPIVASVASATIVIAVLVLFLVLKNKKSTCLQGLLHLLPWTSTVNDAFANKKSRRFTYSEVVKMTSNFQRVLGKGGFGMVYHGTVNGSEVAVKVLSQTSTQGYKEFKAEVFRVLKSSQLNYDVYRLRDVKTANILLDEHFKAKLADCGLSRSFQGGGESLGATGVAGTLGYLDPEYYRTSRLSEKSDVYSFGIVLLEIITNQPVINHASENLHITQWVAFKVNRGDLTEIMDPNLCKDYDSSSAWRAVELAMSCADPSSSKRPSMSQVIHELKECIVCENLGISKNPGMGSLVVNTGLDTSVAPMAR